MPAAKITETMRSAALRRPLKPSVIRDSEVPGFCLHVTTRRSFWALSYQPRGRNPATGKRWGGGVRHELGDALLMTVAEARAKALTAKGLIGQGRSPHHEAKASKAAAEAERAVIPTTVAKTLDAYSAALMTRREPSEWTRKQSVRYARLACRLMNTLDSPLASLNTRMVRLLAETAPGSDAQRRHIFGGLNRFLGWCLKQELISLNPCSSLDKHDRPKPGKARDHVPSLATLRAIWSAAADEPAGDLLRFLLVTPLRRNEASGLRWSEVDLDQNRIRIAAHRTKARETQELPLSPPARAIIEARLPRHSFDKLSCGTAVASSDLVFPSSEGKPHTNWARMLTRIRKTIGEDQKDKKSRASIHDFRRGFVSHLAERGFDVDLLDQCLGHRRVGVLGIYQRSARMADRARALSRYADLILGVDEGDNVVPLLARHINV